MRKYVAPVAIAAAVAAVAGAGIADGASSSHPKLQIRQIAGKSIKVRPLNVTGVNAYKLRCPSGWYLTGVGVGPGANEIVFAVPNNDKSASFSFANSDESETFDSFGTITCAKGAGGLRAVAAQTSSEREAAVRQAREALR